MNRLKAVLQSKSANAPPRRNAANKKSWSSGEVTRLVSKKRGVYVEKKNKSKGAGEHHPIVAKRPPKNEKEFLNSVLTILSQETAGTQFPEEFVPEKHASNKRKARKRTPKDTADMGSQDLDAVAYNSDHTPKENVSPTASSTAFDANTKRRRRFRSRTLNSHINETLQLTEPLTVIKQNNESDHFISSKASSTVHKTVFDGQKLIDSKHSHIETTSKSLTFADEPALKDIPKAITLPGEPPAELCSKEKTKSKVRIMEPKKEYEDGSDEKHTTEKKSNHQLSTHEVNSSQRLKSHNFYYEVSQTTLDGLHETEPNALETISRKQPATYFPIPVVEKERQFQDYDNAMDNVEVFTTRRRVDKPKVTFDKAYDDYARVCNMRSKYFNNATRKQYELRQSQPPARTKVFTNQDKKRSTMSRNKGTYYPLLEQLRKELSLEPDWFVEPDNMHDALLKVIHERKRAREAIKFPNPSNIAFRRYDDQSECMVRGKKRRVIPAARKLYKPKVVGYHKQRVHPDVDYNKYNINNKSASVIRAEVTPNEDYNLLYSPLQAPPSLSVQNYHYYREDTALHSIYLSRKPGEIDSLTSKDDLQSPRRQKQHEYVDNNYTNKYIEERDVYASVESSDTTLRLLMSAQALDYDN